MTGIYHIVCRSNDRRYIGSAINIALRWSAHRRDLRAGRHCNPKLQSAWDKYGEADFTFETLIECSQSELLSKEQFFIDFMSSTTEGFNIAAVAGSRIGVPQPESVKNAASRTWKGVKRPPETIARMRLAQGSRSLEWRQNIANAKRKANGATRRPIAQEKRKNMARFGPRKPKQLS